MLETTKKPSRETSKGKVNKYDAKHNSTKAKFPMRTFEVREELLQYCRDFFPEFEFLFMLFGVIMVLFSLILLIKLLVPERIETNLVFYLTCLVLMVTSQNLNKDTFAHGYFKLSDESKLQLVFAIKSFLVVWIMLSYTDGAVAAFIGLDVDKLHAQAMQRIN